MAKEITTRISLCAEIQKAEDSVVRITDALENGIKPTASKRRMLRELLDTLSYAVELVDEMEDESCS